MILESDLKWCDKGSENSFVFKDLLVCEFHVDVFFFNDSTQVSSIPENPLWFLNSWIWVDISDSYWVFIDLKFFWFFPYFSVFWFSNLNFFFLTEKTPPIYLCFLSNRLTPHNYRDSITIHLPLHSFLTSHPSIQYWH